MPFEMGQLSESTQFTCMNGILSPSSDGRLSTAPFVSTARLGVSNLHAMKGIEPEPEDACHFQATQECVNHALHLNRRQEGRPPQKLKPMPRDARIIYRAHDFSDEARRMTSFGLRVWIVLAWTNSRFMRSFMADALRELFVRHLCCTYWLCVLSESPSEERTNKEVDGTARAACALFVMYSKK